MVCISVKTFILAIYILQYIYHLRVIIPPLLTPAHLLNSYLHLSNPILNILSPFYQYMSSILFFWSFRNFSDATTLLLTNRNVGPGFPLNSEGSSLWEEDLCHGCTLGQGSSFHQPFTYSKRWLFEERVASYNTHCGLQWQHRSEGWWLMKEILTLYFISHNIESSLPYNIYLHCK